jgi:hypothetical protein
VRRNAYLILLLPLLAACQPLAMSMLGGGVGTALRYYGVDGVTYRTFTAPAAEVKQASLAALERMGLTVGSLDRFESGEVIHAHSEQRAIDIEVEPISPKATRVRIAAKNGGMFYDGATASEIVAQTERLLESAARGSSTPPAASIPAGAITPASTVAPALPKTSAN